MAPQCGVDSDCTDETAPVCSGQVCVEKCSQDSECTDASASHCDSAGVCVACTVDVQCSAENNPVCDTSSHECRACEKDGECASGVCIEATGDCATEDQLLFVVDTGSDNAQCSRAAPCKTVAAAVAVVTGQRNVVRLDGTAVKAGAITITAGPSRFTVDGAGTTILGTGSDADPIFALHAGTIVRFEGISAGSAGTNPTLLSVGGGSASCLAMAGLNYQIGINTGALEIQGSAITGLSLTGGSADVSIRDSSLTASAVVLTGGAKIVMQRNQLSGLVSLTGSGTNAPAVTFTDNVLSAHKPRAVGLHVLGAQPHSVIAFNTLVNDATVDTRFGAILCDANDDVSNNIFAWSTTQPPSCATTYSLFDSNTTQTGSGNQSLDVNSFFVDLANGDFHLAPTSPAIGAGSALPSVTTDIDGKPRATPPAIGAYEGP